MSETRKSTSGRKAPRRTRGKPTDVDQHVGRRVRARRQLLGLSQTTLADRLEVTFQQVQKYERGTNRIGAGRLWQLSQALDVSPGYFFAGIDDFAEVPEGNAEQDRRAMATARELERLPPAGQKAVRDLVRALLSGEVLKASMAEHGVQAHG